MLIKTIVIILSILQLPFVLLCPSNILKQNEELNNEYI